MCRAYGISSSHLLCNLSEYISSPLQIVQEQPIGLAKVIGHILRTRFSISVEMLRLWISCWPQSILVHLGHSWWDKKCAPGRLDSLSVFHHCVLSVTIADQCRSWYNIMYYVVDVPKFLISHLSCGRRAPDLSSPLQWTLILISDSCHIALMSTCT